MKPNQEANVRRGPQLVPVRFEFPHSTAIAVCVVHAGIGIEWSDALVPDHALEAFRGRNPVLNAVHPPKAVRREREKFFPEVRQQIETAKH